MVGLGQGLEDVSGGKDELEPANEWEPAWHKTEGGA